MKYWHKRGDIVSFFELTEEQQNDALAYNGDNGAQEGSYLVTGETMNDYYNLDLFTLSEGRYHGVMGVTNTSATGIILSNCGDQAVIQHFG